MAAGSDQPSIFQSMNTPTNHSRVTEFCSLNLDTSAQLPQAAFCRAMPDTTMRWRVNRAFWIKDALPHAMQACNVKWPARPGEPEQPGFRCWSGDVEVDVRSPLTAQAFHAMPFAEQVVFLSSWKPKTSNWDGPVREGLAATLQAEAKAQPVFYFEHADQLTGLDPLYSTALVRGFSEGLDGKTVTDWKPFWRFANWILEQPDPETKIRDDFSGSTQLGRRWQSSRLEIARFVDAILNGNLAPLPLAERASVWHLIAVLGRDPSPMSAEETHDDDRVVDPLALSLNTVTGVAFHAVFSFVRWIRSFGLETGPAAQLLDDVPEARAALDAHLHPQSENSTMIQSVFGANLTRLSWWAEAWLRKNLDRILESRGQNTRRCVAWETFIRFSLADSRTLALLHPQYTAAIDGMARDVVAGCRGHDGWISLGQHLVMSYCQDELPSEQPGDLLEAFFARAPGTVRAEVVAFVGRTLAHPNDPIPAEIFGRLLKVWNWLNQHESPEGRPGFQARVA
jgi:hypothetical protein